MALAVLRFLDDVGRGYRFRADLGGNRYYAYTVGDDETDRQNGVQVLRNRVHTSKLFGPLPDSAMGRTALTVPRQWIDRENRYVQLFTYRTRDLVGPAISDIVKLRPTGAAPVPLPPIPLPVPGAHAMQTSDLAPETVALSYREQPLSTSLFLGSLFSMLPKVLPKVLPIAGKLLGGLVKSGGSKPGAAAGQGNTLNLVADLLQQVLAAKNGAATAKSLSYDPQLSHSQALPAALLAALPALAPILKQALNPQTIKAITENIGPQKTIGAVTDSVMKLGKLSMQGHKQVLDHIEKVHPDDEALDKLIAGMSLSLQAPYPELKFQRVESVRLDFDGLTPLQLYGRTRSLYRHGQDLSFPMRLSTPRSIRRGVLQLVVKDPESLELLYQKKWRVEGLQSGAVAAVPKLPASAQAMLRANEDYLVSVLLVWRNRKGKRRGTSMSQLITLMPAYAFDRVDGTGELLALDDPAIYRDYWHKLWQGSFSSDWRRLKLQGKYYFALEGDRPRHARAATEHRLSPAENRRRSGRLKSGFHLSPFALNALLPRLADTAPLGKEELAALQASDFADRFNQVARFQVKLRGRAGETAALWVYPEMKMQRLILQSPAAVNDSGHVTALAEHPVQFPMPALLHVLAVSNEKRGPRGGEKTLFGGMQVRSDERAALSPANLVAKTPETKKRRRSPSHG